MAAQRRQYGDPTTVSSNDQLARPHTRPRRLDMSGVLRVLCCLCLPRVKSLGYHQLFRFLFQLRFDLLLQSHGLTQRTWAGSLVQINNLEPSGCIPASLIGAPSCPQILSSIVIGSRQEQYVLQDINAAETQWDRKSDKICMQHCHLSNQRCHSYLLTSTPPPFPQSPSKVTTTHLELCFT